MHTKKIAPTPSFRAFDLAKVEKKKRESSKCLSLWIPEEQKADYDHLQKESEHEFGKSLQKLIVKYIKAAIEKNKAG